MPDPIQQLVDALRRRIADPGAFLPRRFDAGQPVETMAAWRARAVAASLEDGTLGYVPAAQYDRIAAELSDAENALDALDLDGKIAVTLTITGHRNWGGHVTVTGFETEWTATDVGKVLAQALANHTGATVTQQWWRRPVPGSSRRAQEPAASADEFRGLSQVVEVWREYSDYDRRGVERYAPVLRIVLDAADEYMREVEQQETVNECVPAGEPQASEPARRPLSPVSAVAVEVIAELARAEAKFPDQHLPDGTGGPVAQAIGALLKAMCQANGTGQDTWMAVVAEEVGESFAETEWAKLRPELVQVAAMAIRWILDGDGRRPLPAMEAEDLA